MTNRHMARLVCSTAALCLLALLGACSSGGSSNGAGDRPKVALITITEEQSFFTQMNVGAEAAAKKAGVDLTIYNPNNDASAQSQAIQTYTQQGFDAIIVDAIDTEGIKPAIKQAASSGVKIIAIDSVVDDPAVDLQVGVDNGKAAKEGATWLANWAKENNATPLSVGVVGALNSMIQNERKDQFVSGAKADGAQIVQSVDGKNDVAAAASAAENLVTAQTDMNVVYGTAEPATLGAVAAVKSQKVGDRIKVFGWDLSARAIEGIDDGTVIGIIQQDPKTEGAKAVAAAKTLVTGAGKLEDINVPITIVTKANVDAYRSAFGS
jgi:ribose transport system substrate-binding protein